MVADGEAAATAAEVAIGADSAAVTVAAAEQAIVGRFWEWSLNLWITLSAN